jgi:transposase
LNRFEERGFEAALYDESRPGRSSKLTDDQSEQFAAVLHGPPEEAGYDAPAWSSALAQQYLIEAFDVAFFSPTYSSTHARGRGLAEETPATTSLC